MKKTQHHFKKLNSNGFSVLHVLLLLVILGIVAFTGYFVWQSQQSINKNIDQSLRASNSNSTSTKAKSQSGSTQTKLVSVKVDGDDATMEVPETWIVKSVPSQSGQEYVQTTTITSPNDTVYVKFERLGGLGGACSAEDTLATLKKVTITPVASDAALRLIEYYVSDGKTYFGVGAYVTTKTLSEKIVEGASICDAYLTDVIGGFKTNPGGARLNISSKTIDSKHKSSESTISTEEYSEFVNSDEYKVAKKILLSLKY